MSSQRIAVQNRDLRLRAIEARLDQVDDRIGLLEEQVSYYNRIQSRLGSRSGIGPCAAYREPTADQSATLTHLTALVLHLDAKIEELTSVVAERSSRLPQRAAA